ncbi:PPC domain-containing protein [Lysobacter tyrosinilyticus]
MDGSRFVHQATWLDNCVAVVDQAGKAGEALLFRINVPPGVRRLTLRAQGQGGVALFVRYEAVPTRYCFDYESVLLGNIETVAINFPIDGTYFLSVIGRSDFSEVFVLAMYV